MCYQTIGFRVCGIQSNKNKTILKNQGRCYDNYKLVKRFCKSLNTISRAKGDLDPEMWYQTIVFRVHGIQKNKNKTECRCYGNIYSLHILEIIKYQHLETIVSLRL